MNAEELLEQYAANVREFSGVDLSGHQFKGANLSGINLSQAILTRSNFSVAKLANANFSRAQCDRANFHGARLTLADLSHAELNQADFSKAELTRADLNGASLRSSDLSQTDLRDVTLRCANLNRANLTRSDLRHAKLLSANLAYANLANSDLSSADLSGADLRYTELRQANFNRANLQGANLQGANLRWADLSGADLRWADLTGTKLSGANLTGADLSHATLLNATLVHVDLTRANLAWVDWSGADLSGSSLTGAKLHGVLPFGIKTDDATCQWVDLSPNGDQSQLYQFLTPDPGEFFHQTPPIVQIVIDDRLSTDAHCALAVAYQQMARHGGAIVPPHIEVHRRRTILRFELERDEQLFFTAYIAIFPFQDAGATQQNLLNAVKLVPTKALSDTARLHRFQMSVSALSQSMQKLDTAKLLQVIPVAIQKIRFFQAPSRSVLLNSNNQALTIYDNPEFGKRRIKRSQSEEVFAFLTQPTAFRPPTEEDAIDFIEGFHNLT
jgi:uncharacterized protein YjbI with pentapeptide repeats